MSRTLAKNAVKPTGPRDGQPGSRTDGSQAPGPQQAEPTPDAGQRPAGPKRREQVRTKDEIDREGVATEQEKVAEHNKQKDQDHERKNGKNGKKGPQNQAKKEDDGVNAFLKGFGSGFIHVKGEQAQAKKAMKGTTPLSSIHDQDSTLASETVAESFGYTSEADQKSWRDAGQAGRGETTGAQSGAAEYAAEADLKHESAEARRDYQPSIPIEDPQIGGPEMGR